MWNPRQKQLLVSGQGVLSAHSVELGLGFVWQSQVEVVYDLNLNLMERLCTDAVVDLKIKGKYFGCSKMKW